MNSAQAGNWSAGATWVGGVAPTDATPVLIVHAVTLDVGVSRTAPTEVKGDGVLTLAANPTLNSVFIALTRNAGNTKCGELHITGAMRKVICRATYGTLSGISCDGSPEARGVIAGESTTNFLDLTDVSTDTGAGFPNIQYCDMVFIGSDTVPSFAPRNAFTESLQPLIIKHATMDSCGEIAPQFAFRSDWFKLDVDGLTMRNTRHATNCAHLQGQATPLQVRNLTNCAFDKPPDLSSPVGFNLNGTIFRESYGLSGEGPWLSASGCLHRSSVQANAGMAGDFKDSIVLEDHAFANPHALSPWIGGDSEISGNIFQYTGSDTSGDFLPLSAAGAASVVIAIKQNILLPNGAGGPSGTLYSQNGRAGMTIAGRRNTYRSNGSAAANVLETYAGHAGMIEEHQGNISWSDTPGEAVQISDVGAAVPGTTTTPNLITIADYNLTFNGAADAYKPADGNFAATPGVHDLTVDPQFYDVERRIEAWDESLGGPGTVENALDELCKMNDATGYNPAYTIAALRTYIRIGYTPQNAACDGSGPDGEDMGAVDFAIIPPEEPPEEEPAAVVTTGSIYAATARRALATIARKGAPVVFPGAIVGTPGVYDAETDTTTGGTPAADAVGRAVQVEGDPDRFAALNLVLVNPVTLIVAAYGLPITPTPGMQMTWAGTTYTIKDPNPVAPDGEPIIYTVTASV